MPLNETLALTMALAESEIKRKQTESMLAEARQIIDILQQKLAKLDPEFAAQLSGTPVKTPKKKRGPYKKKAPAKAAATKVATPAVEVSPKAGQNGQPAVN